MVPCGNHGTRLLSGIMEIHGYIQVLYVLLFNYIQFSIFSSLFSPYYCNGLGSFPYMPFSHPFDLLFSILLIALNLRMRFKREKGIFFSGKSGFSSTACQCMQTSM